MNIINNNLEMEISQEFSTNEISEWCNAQENNSAIDTNGENEQKAFSKFLGFLNNLTQDQSIEIQNYTNMEDDNLTIQQYIQDLQCRGCQQIFKKRHHLVEHIRAIHLKISKFVCRVCDESFKRANPRNVHERFEHQYCHNCQFYAATMKIMIEHCNRYHKNKPRKY